MLRRVSAWTLAAGCLLAAVVAQADTVVRGTTRKDGTYVAPHFRTDPNRTVTDNYSFKGNLNPYTGTTGTKRYTDSPSSPYYRGSTGSGYKAPTYKTPSFGSYKRR